MASSGASRIQRGAWGTRERGSGSSLVSSLDLDHSLGLVGYSSGNTSCQVSNYLITTNYMYRDVLQRCASEKKNEVRQNS